MKGAQEQKRYRGRRSPSPPGEHAFLAEIDGRVCGSLAWSRQGTTVTVDHVYVDEWARGVGVGDALMNSLLVEAKRIGARSVGSSALPGDRALKNLFERNGLVAREILVERMLD